MLTDFFFDYETRSRADLKKVGTVKYATDPSTEATLITWAFGMGEVKPWRIGQPIPPELVHVALNPEKFHFIAHNILFDYLIWTVVFAKLIPGLKRPPIKNITDNMALTNYNRFGSSLDHAASFLRLPYSKDKEGRVLMLKQCKPRSTGKEAGKFYELTPEEWVHFERYGIVDTKLLREIYYRCRPLTGTERYGFEWTFKRNLRGNRIDMDLLQVLEDILAVEIPRLETKFKRITGFNVGQRAKCLAFFKHFYPQMENMQKETVDDVLGQDIHPNSLVHEALQIKAEVGSTSLAKVAVARRMQHEGRLYDIWVFLKAHTRRWAGKGIQPQNFPRGGKIAMLDDDNIVGLASKIKQIKDLSEDQCQLVKDLLRKLWLADEGKTFYCGDFSKIEPTVLYWLLGMGPIPKKWYEETAAEIYGVKPDQIGKDSEERQVGKGAALGSGYGQGAKGFQKQQKKNAGLNLTIELCARAVQAYRRKNWQVVDFWGMLEMAFRTALQGQVGTICNGKVHFMPMKKPHSGVKVRLPSGSFLFYPGAKQKEGKLCYEVFEKGAVRDEKTYGGKLCENVVSAIARDVMLSSMYKLEAAGFENLGTVHDEVWSQHIEGQDELYESTMCSIPSWCTDMHVTVESKNGTRYLK